MTISMNDRIPAFQAATYPTGTITDSDFIGKWTVLFFYPKDNTSGCTQESIEFQQALDKLASMQTQVIGISKDSMASHESFCSKFGLTFPLISDEDEHLCQLFGVLKEKTNYGKTYIGIERSTFLFNPDGVLVSEWRKVSVAGHVDEVIQCIQSLQV